MDESEGKQTHKSHQDPHSGRKAKKKKNKNEHEQELTPKQRNPKAFSVQNVVRAERRFRRTMDVQAKRHHMPLVDHTPIEPPPIVVGIVGPPKVGKTTLLRCLIKNFTKQNMSDVRGPITIVSGKKRRLTFLECSNDLSTMIDIAKVADLVLLLVDASFGFEMETFEFLNICQAHGFPRIMGILTHLDVFRNTKQLRKTKKTLKHRFWTEIYPGAKLFYLSGMVHDEYQKTEIHNLGRFISVMKFRPLQFRVTHPYVLADRFEDLTDPEKLRQHPKCDRVVCFYGYSRGANFKSKSAIHIPGCGDFIIKDISFLPDPCPLPDKEKKRSLNEKEKLIYAPLAGVGGIVYDKDAVYIDLGGSHSHSSQKEQIMEPINELVVSLVESQHTFDTKIAASTLQIFKGAAPISSEEAERNPDMLNSMEKTVTDPVTGRKRRKVVFADEEDIHFAQVGDSSSDDENDQSPTEDSENEYDGNMKQNLKRKALSGISETERHLKRHKKSNETSYFGREAGSTEKLAFDDDDDSGSDIVDNDGKLEDDENEEEDEEGEEEEGVLKWKNDLAKKAADAFYRRQEATPNLRRLVYGKATEHEDNTEETHSDGEEVGGLFRIAREQNKQKQMQRSLGNTIDCSKFLVQHVQDWNLEDVQEKIKDCFVTGKWKGSEDAQKLLEQDDNLYGDFEDFETGEIHKSGPSAKRDSNDMEDDTNSSDSAGDTQSENEALKENEKSNDKKRLEKKKRLKEMFNSEYDDNEGETSYYNDLKAELDQQSQLNKSEFMNMDDDVRVNYEGFRPGMYVRVEVEDVPCELVTNFDPSYPMILGGLLSGESNIGFVQVRLKKHRWYKRILKTRDPLTFSLGWRRFQTIPLFCIQDHNGRNRLLKYTPEHLHCVASFWGPITPQGNGFIAVQNIADVTANFRIAASGVVTELDKSTQIVKKLKITGTPYKIYKKTAFIKGMFSSILEVSKFEGAAIRTVSGIRGQIKKAEKNPEGAYRATFEDKILLSDIVFLRTWYEVHVPQFYNPLTNLLLPTEEKTKWRGMRTVGQLRRDLNIPLISNDDSIYKPVMRTERAPKPLVIPKALQKDLPYKNKPKIFPERIAPNLQKQRIAVIKEPQERKVSQLMKMIKTVYQDKQRKERLTMRQRVEQHKKQLSAIEAKSIAKQKDIKKKIYRSLGKLDKRKNKERH